MSRSKNYKKIKSASDIYQNAITGKFLVEKGVKENLHTASFPVSMKLNSGRNILMEPRPRFQTVQVPTPH